MPTPRVVTISFTTAPAWLKHCIARTTASSMAALLLAGYAAMPTPISGADATPATAAVSAPTLQQPLRARYQYARLHEVAADLQRRAGVEVWFPPALGRIAGFTLHHERLTVRALLDQLAIHTGVTMTMADGRVGLWKNADDQVIAGLTDQLGSGTADERIAAAHDLAQLGDQRIYPLLLPLIDDADSVLAMMIVHYLGDHPLALQTAAPVPYASLLRWVADPRVGMTAARLLGRSDRPELVDALIALAANADGTQRLHAATGLGQTRDPRAIPVLITLTRDADPDVRLRAVDGLGYAADPRATETLIIIASDRSAEWQRVGARIITRSGDAAQMDLGLQPHSRDPWAVRLSAITALGRSGDPRAVVPLLEIVQDDEWAMRFIANASLGYLSCPEALTALEMLAGDRDPEIRQDASRGLVEKDDPRAVDALLTLSQDPDARTRASAIARLGIQGDPRGLQALLDLADESAPHLRAAVVAGLAATRTAQAVDVLMTMLRELGEGDAKQLHAALAASRDPRAIDLLLPLLARRDDAPPHMTWEWEPVVEVLAGHDDPRARAAIRALVEDVTDTNIFQRPLAAAVATLVAMRDPAAIPALLALIRGADQCGARYTKGFDRWSARFPPAEDLWVRGLQALSGCHDPRVVAALGAAFATHMQDPVGEACMRVLVHAHDPRVWDIVSAVIGDTLAQRAASAAAAGFFNDPIGLRRTTTQRIPLRGPRDYEEPLLYTAVESMSGRRDPRVITQLLALVTHPDPHLRHAVAEALATTGDVRAADMCFALTSDPDPLVCFAAVRPLVCRDDPRAWQPLVTLATMDDREYWSVTDGALHLLGRIREPRALDLLLAWSRDAADARRQAAVEGLAESQDPRAWARLLALAEDPESGVRWRVGHALMQHPALTPESLQTFIAQRDAHARAGVAHGVGAQLRRGRRPPHHAIDTLLGLARDEAMEVRQSAATALRHCRDARALDALIRLSEDPEESVRWKAAQSLDLVRDVRGGG